MPTTVSLSTALFGGTHEGDMAFEPFDLDHKRLDVFLATVLDAYKDGQISRNRAVDLLGHVVTAAAIDDEPTFKATIWLPDRYLKE